MKSLTRRNPKGEQRELQNHRRILVDLLGAGFSDKPDDFDFSVVSHDSCLLELVEAFKWATMHP